jgi:hypothetical protein
VSRSSAPSRRQYRRESPTWAIDSSSSPSHAVVIVVPIPARSADELEESWMRALASTTSAAGAPRRARAVGQPLLEHVDRDLGGDLPGRGPAHAVGHAEQRRAHEPAVLVHLAMAARVGHVGGLGDAQHQLIAPGT